MGHYDGNGPGPGKFWKSLRISICSIFFIISIIVQASSLNPDSLHLTRDFSNYNVIIPKILIENSLWNVKNERREKRHVASETTLHKDQDKHINNFKLELQLVDSKIYTLDLHLKRDLITEHYFVRTQSSIGEPIISKNHSLLDLCQYHGTIHGIPNSWAAISTCQGLRGVVFDGNEIHYLEPSQRNQSAGIRDPESLETIHFKDAHRLKNFTCDHKTHGLLFPLPIGNQNKNGSLSRAKRSADSPPGNLGVPNNANSKSRYVEMVIVIDHRKYNDLKGDVKGIALRTKDIINVVNAMYKPLNIFIALTGLVIWNQKDEIQISSKGDDTLSSFLFYRRERLLKDHPNDNAQLLTGMEFEDGVVGKAMQGPICSYKYSGGVNSDHSPLIGIVATTVAHELGHNFGLSHDTEACTCDGPESKCIMSPSSSSNRTAHWSSCSLESMKHAFEHGMEYCLRNVPKSLYDSPTCGNGFLEEGEECDCGTQDPEQCENQCCDASSCTLVSWATCGHGECCDLDICHPKSGGTICREAIGNGSCDLPEYCNGLTSFCPADVYKQNGMDCETTNGKAYCYDGKCTTHADQCQLLWGPSGKNSDEICYQKNVNGSQHGHCGYNLATQEYAKCGRENVKCGVLQCEHHHEKLEFGYERVAILPSFFVTIGGKIHPCRSVTTDFGLDVVDPGLVPNGAICGTDKMCVDQKCVPVPTILSPFACPLNCNSNGICNSKGHCHCNPGFGGESCDSGGYGGSEDSGPIVDPLGKSSIFSRALYVTFLGFIPLIGVISFYLYHANDNIKKICKRGWGRTVGSNASGRVQDNKPQPTQNGSTTRNSAAPLPNGTVPSQPSNVPNAPDDFFGSYRGFSLSPIKQSNGHTPNGAAAATKNPNVVYQAQLEQQLLVQNEKPIANAAALAKRNFLNNGTGSLRAVSWKDPVATSAPIPDVDTVDGDGNLKTTVQIPPIDADNSSNGSEGSDNLNSTLLCNGNGPKSPTSPASKSSSIKKQFSFSGSTTTAAAALSRFAAAAISPFRTNPTAKNANSEEDSKRDSISSLGRQKSFNRDTLEISKPILQENRYENLTTPVPVCSPKKSPRLSLRSQNQCVPNVKPVLKSLDRIKNGQAPPIPTPDYSNQPQQQRPKKSTVQRAHSMVAAHNRNSVSSNSNYNSLRRQPRPTVPPPPVPNAAPPAAKPNSLISNSNCKAPIARMDDSDMGSSSPTSTQYTMSPGSPKLGLVGSIPGVGAIAKIEDPIYDTIADDEPSPSATIPSSTILSSECEKIETLSTGSSENGSGGGLLSDIICEIQSRNRDSIYNSVDRRKLKQMRNAMQKKQQNSSTPAPPEPSVKPTVLTPVNQQSTGGTGTARITLNPSFGLVKPSSPKGLTKNSTNGPPPIILPKPQILASASVPSAPIVPITSKPTCLVKPNGIPKVTAAPAPPLMTPNNNERASPPPSSYITKINHLNDKKSNGPGTSSNPVQMKPINSLSQAIITAPAPADEIIYAPGQLSTIRRGSRPSSMHKKNFPNGLVENGIYSSGNSNKAVKVPVPQVPDIRSRSGSASPTPAPEKPAEPSSIEEPTQTQGYKPFNPYLNRPLTFSTFRPTIKNSAPAIVNNEAS